MILGLVCYQWANKLPGRVPTVFSTSSHSVSTSVWCGGVKKDGAFSFFFPLSIFFVLRIFGFADCEEHGSKPYSTAGEELWIIPGVC